MADKKKILIADDDEAIRTTYQLAFESGGYEVATANDGAEALEKVKKDKPDAMILDIMMPKLGGKEVLTAIQADPVLKSIKVVACSALIEEIGRKEMMSLGAADYEVKIQIDPSALVAKVNQILGAKGNE